MQESLTTFDPKFTNLIGVISGYTWKWQRQFMQHEMWNLQAWSFVPPARTRGNKVTRWPVVTRPSPGSSFLLHVPRVVWSVLSKVFSFSCRFIFSDIINRACLLASTISRMYSRNGKRGILRGTRKAHGSVVGAGFGSWQGQGGFEKDFEVRLCSLTSLVLKSLTNWSK